MSDFTRNDTASRPASRRRSLTVGVVAAAMLSVVMLGLLGRVLQLQLDPSPRVAELLDSQSTIAEVPARRGTLLDRRGRVVAATRMAHRLFVDPLLIVERPTFSDRVAHELGYDAVEIEKALHRRPDSRFIVIDERLTDAKLAAVREADIPGLAVQPYLVRDYPQHDLAGQLLGFVGVDNEGLEGVERDLDETLDGEAGRFRVVRDARGRRMWFDPAEYVANRDGPPVRLSIDLTIQSIAQRELAGAVEKFNAESGQMVVMDPWTGEILAMALYPTFDPGAFRDSKAELRRNRAVTDVFEPGSIFKPIVWAALTARGVADPDERIDCTEAGYYVSPQGRVLRDARGHGVLTWDEVLVESSNIGMFLAAQRIDVEALHEIVRAFGFGRRTGSGLPGEQPGLVNPLRRWNHYSQSSVPMGQEIAVTALQMTRAFCTLATDGAMPTPTIRAVNEQAASYAVIREKVLPVGVAEHTRRILRRVVVEGTGRKADSELYTIFGKTGTAQLPDFENGGYHQDRYVSSFVGGAPTRTPRLVVGCFIREPDKKIGHYGGIVAGPAVQRTLEQSLLYLEVPPTTDASDAAEAGLAHAQP